jgi:hypothetical protein
MRATRSRATKRILDGDRGRRAASIALVFRGVGGAVQQFAAGEGGSRAAIRRRGAGGSRVIATATHRAGIGPFRTACASGTRTAGRFFVGPESRAEFGQDWESAVLYCRFPA